MTETMHRPPFFQINRQKNIFHKGNCFTESVSLLFPGLRVVVLVDTFRNKNSMTASRKKKNSPIRNHSLLKAAIVNES
jgi:hypothetical protein